MQSTAGYPQGLELGEAGADTGRTLIVILHGWCGSALTMHDVCAASRDALRPTANGLDLFVPTMPYSRWYSFTSPTDITAGLLADLDRICADPERYGRIFLVGHSMGAVIARRLFLVAAGMNAQVHSEGKLGSEGARPWAGRVQRIVTLAGLNRGWVRSGRLGWQESIVSAVVALAGHGWIGSSAPTLFAFRRGAPFIVHTRLQWLALQRDRAAHKPLVVQLLGTQDNLVAPDDAVDFAIDGTANNNYLYMELPQTDHDEAMVFASSRHDPGGAKGNERRERFTAALTDSREALTKRSVDRRFLADALPSPPEPKVERVVFVIHGIRDDGYWTRRIAQRIREAAGKKFGPGADTHRTITATYGYFAMLPFILPWIRREKVEWLMDQYVLAVSQYPRADFSYVGHSNGTYLLARALDDYPAAHFENVLFAGSVVRRDYLWNRLIAAGRISRVVNMVATADWVVAIFPSGLEPLRPFDLGGAGFRGFRQAGTVSDLHEVRYVTGGHSAALVETQWPRIADFIVSNTVPSPPDDNYVPTQSRLWTLAAALSSLILTVIILGFGAAPLAVLLYFIIHSSNGVEGAGYAAIACAYLALLKFVVTRV